MANLPWATQEQQNAFLVDTLDTIGREVIFNYVISVSGCPVCSLDPVSNTSTDAFCVTCSGAYWLETIEPYPTKAHITWKSSEGTAWYSAGTQQMGDCTVRVNYSSGIASIIDTTKYIEVDGRVMQISKSNLRGAPVANRIILTLLEKENES